MNLRQPNPVFYSIKPKIDLGLFGDFCFTSFFHDVIIKLFGRYKTKQFYDHINAKTSKNR